MPTIMKAPWILAAGLASAACPAPSGSTDAGASDESDDGTSGGETGDDGAPDIELDWSIGLDAGADLALVCDVAVAKDGTVVVAGVSVDRDGYSPKAGWIRIFGAGGEPGKTIPLPDLHSPGGVTVGTDGAVFVTGSFGDVDGDHGLWFARFEGDGSQAWYEAESGDAWTEGVFSPCWDADAGVSSGGRYVALVASDAGMQTSFRIFDADGNTQATAVLDEALAWAPAKLVVDGQDHFFVAGRVGAGVWSERRHVVEKYDFAGQRAWSSPGPGSILGVLSGGPGGSGVGLLGEPVDDGVLRVGSVDADGVEEWTGAWPHLETHHPGADWGEAIVYMQTFSHDPLKERLAGMWIDGSSAWTHPIDDSIDASSVSGLWSAADGALYMFGVSADQASWLARLTRE